MHGRHAARIARSESRADLEAFECGASVFSWFSVSACFRFVAPVSAHHSFAAEFDAKQKISLTGVVTKVEWTNPHVWFWVNVKDPATGEVVNWGGEMGSPNALQRTGWSHNTLEGRHGRLVHRQPREEWQPQGQYQQRHG